MIRSWSDRTFASGTRGKADEAQYISTVSDGGTHVANPLKQPARSNWQAARNDRKTGETRAGCHLPSCERGRTPYHSRAPHPAVSSYKQQARSHTCGARLRAIVEYGRRKHEDDGRESAPSVDLATDLVCRRSRSLASYSARGGVGRLLWRRFWLNCSRLFPQEFAMPQLEHG